MLYFVCRVDIAAVIHEMHTVESHKARSSGDSVQAQGAACLVRFRAKGNHLATFHALRQINKRKGDSSSLPADDAGECRRGPPPACGLVREPDPAEQARR